VLDVAADLLGCIVEHDGCLGRIVETEAYHESEPACHAFVGLTPRTRTLFGAPGHAYVYRSYGIHALLNAVCEPAGVGAAVLIRALEPLHGITLMRARRQPRRDLLALERPAAPANLDDRDLCSGPGKLSQALGIELEANGADLTAGPVVIHGRPEESPLRAVQGARVGITRAVELPWRFCLAGNPHVSRPWPRVGAQRGAWLALAGGIRDARPARR
jgi:DNA-3-methyladenine glycosylase